MECGINYPKIQPIMKEDFRPIVRSIVIVMNMFSCNVDELKTFVESILSEDQTKLPTDLIDGRSKYTTFLRHFDMNHPDGSNMSKLNIQSIYSALMAHKTFSQHFKTKHHQRFLMHLIGHHISSKRSIASGGTFRSKFVIPIIGSYFNHSCIPNGKCNKTFQFLFTSDLRVLYDQVFFFAFF